MIMTSKKPSGNRKRILRREDESAVGRKRKAAEVKKRTAALKNERARSRKVEFHFQGIQGVEAFLSGDFNEWDLRSLPMQKNQKGDWNRVISLLPGRYEFKALADGAWVEDVACRVYLQGTSFTLALPIELVYNSFGTKNFAAWIW